MSVRVLLFRSGPRESFPVWQGGHPLVLKIARPPDSPLLVGAWFPMALARAIGWPMDSHSATGFAAGSLACVNPWHSAQCFDPNRFLPRPASPGRSKKRAEKKYAKGAAR